MDATGERRSPRVMLLAALVYLVTGLAFAEFARWSTANATVIMWRRLAWLVSGVAFAAHIGIEHFRLRNSPRFTAIHAGIAAALGACGLAAAANVNGWLFASGNRRALGIALVAWPLLTVVPAFVAALVVALALNRLSRKSSASG